MSVQCDIQHTAKTYMMLLCMYRDVTYKAFQVLLSLWRHSWSSGDVMSASWLICNGPTSCKCININVWPYCFIKMMSSNICYVTAAMITTALTSEWLIYCYNLRNTSTILGTLELFSIAAKISATTGWIAESHHVNHLLYKELLTHHIRI